MNEHWGSVSRRDRVVRRVLFVAAFVVFFALTAALSFGDTRQTVVTWSSVPRDGTTVWSCACATTASA